MSALTHQSQLEILSSSIYITATEIMLIINHG